MAPGAEVRWGVCARGSYVSTKNLDRFIISEEVGYKCVGRSATDNLSLLSNKLTFYHYILSPAILPHHLVLYCTWACTHRQYQLAEPVKNFYAG